MKVKTKTVHEINYYDFCEEITKLYMPDKDPKNHADVFEFEEIQGGEEYKSFASEWNEEEDGVSFRQVIALGYAQTWHVSTSLSKMAHQGHIPTGEYVIILEM